MIEIKKRKGMLGKIDFVTIEVNGMKTEITMDSDEVYELCKSLMMQCYNMLDKGNDKKLVRELFEDDINEQ